MELQAATHHPVLCMQASGTVTVPVAAGSQQGKQQGLQPRQLHAGRQNVGLGSTQISIDLFLQELQAAACLSVLDAGSL